MLIVMGYFNASMGNDMNGWQRLAGRFGLKEQNNNEVKLLDFCSFHSMVVTNTVFQHRLCHQWT